MTSAFREVIDLLEMHKRQVRDAITHCLNFDSEGPTKLPRTEHNRPLLFYVSGANS